MSDLLEHELREVFIERSARITDEASARLREIDYHPRCRRLPSRPALGGGRTERHSRCLGPSVPPRIRGHACICWMDPGPDSTPLSTACRGCQALRPAVRTPPRSMPTVPRAWPETAARSNSSGADGGQPDVPAGTIELRGAGESDSEGRALTMVDGRAGAGVTGVKIARSDGSEVQATVKNGWYLAWWPGTQRPVSAQVASTRADHPILPDHAGQFHSAVSSRRTLLERLRLRLRLRNTRQADDAADHRQTTAAGNNDSASGVGQPAPSRHTPQRLTQGKTASCGIRARTAVHSLRAQHRATFADQSPYRAITRCVVATPGG
jgi:hypothetical protein